MSWLDMGREETSFVSTSRSWHVDVYVRMLTRKQGISVSITADE